MRKKETPQASPTDSSVDEDARETSPIKQDKEDYDNQDQDSYGGITSDDEFPEFTSNKAASATPNKQEKAPTRSGLTTSTKQGQSIQEERNEVETSSPDMFDEDGHKLSAYERQRAKRILRNEARLDRLGLLKSHLPKKKRQSSSKKKTLSSLPLRKSARALSVEVILNLLLIFIRILFFLYIQLRNIFLADSI